MKRTVVEFQEISKGFPGVRALDRVSFSVEEGTIHALVGENGAGKSTLIKILAGIYTNYDGDLLLDGQKLTFKSPSDSLRAGISVVHQEIKLAESLSVTENIFLGNLLYKRGLVDWAGMHRKAQTILGDLGVSIDPDTPVSELSVAKKQIVEICKAINRNCRVIVMDEPSAVLSPKELNVLFQTMKKLTASGMTIVYISHRMEEIFLLADRVTVLRDGRHIATMPLAECDRATLIGLMVGRKIEREYPKEQIALGEVVLKVEGLSCGARFSNISFELHRGEILALAGLVGAGRTEIVHTILGIEKKTSGEIWYKDWKLPQLNFHEAIRYGFGLIPEDRKKQGLVQIASIKENISIVRQDKVVRHGIISNALEAGVANSYKEKLGISAPDINTEVQFLSGGNQQKVVVSKWMFADSEIIIMDEPTRGVDVGAKAEIYTIMTDLVRAGKSIIMISGELPEVLGMCDRVLVIHEGELKGEFSACEATQEGIMSLCV